MLGYGARVPYPIETNPNEGGGPIRRSPLVTEIMPWPKAGNMVYRTPHAVVPDVEPGGAFLPRLWKDKFLPDGRLVPMTALGGFGQAPRFAEGALLYGALAGIVAGATAAALCGKGRRLPAIGVGVLGGALAGLGFSQAVFVAAKAARTA